MSVSNKHRPVILGITSIKFDRHFTMQSIRPLEMAILGFEPETKSAGILYPVKQKGFGQGILKDQHGVPYEGKEPIPGICQVTVTTDRDTKRIAYFRINGNKVERYLEAIPSL